MSEIKSRDVSEAKNPEVENYKNIQPEKGTTVSEAMRYWDKLFGKETNEVDNAEWGGKYNDVEKRLGFTPVDEKLGNWQGERGNSKFIPNDVTEAGKKCKDELEKYGEDGVEYRNLEPDFSECSEATVKIDNMTENREDYLDENGEIQPGNFTQADVKLAEVWNEQKKDGRTDWTEEDVYDYRRDNHLSWHERCDTKTMDLVPYDIHSYLPHLGGVSECKMRDAHNNGGGFDE